MCPAVKRFSNKKIYKQLIKEPKMRKIKPNEAYEMKIDQNLKLSTF